MKRLTCLLLCLLVLCSLVSAAPEASLESELSALRDAYALDESSFSVSYCNIATGTRCSYNEQAFFPAGALWLLPLHLYYYEMETLGRLTPENWYEEEFTIDGMTLSECRYQSILLEDAEVSQKMCAALGSFRQYQLLMNESYGHCAKTLLPDAFYDDTVYSADFLMNCLLAASNHPELYGDLMTSFRMIQTEAGLAASLSGYNYTHLSGSQDAMLCEAVMVDAPQPYLLVCFLGDRSDSEEILDAVSKLFLSDGTRGVPSAEAPTSPRPPREDSDFIIGSATQRDNGRLLRWLGIALALAAAVAALVAVTAVSVKRHRDRRDTDDRE